MPNTPRLFGPWRRLFQITISCLFVVIPFISCQGKSAARLDIPTLTLYLAGVGFRIEELHILLIFLLWIIFLFILITLTLGRIWCGWVCPQTQISDLADFLSRKLSSKKHPLINGTIKQLIYLVVSSIVGCTLVGYFIPPAIFWQGVRQGHPGTWPAGSAIIISTVTYLNFAFIRRLLCKDLCPYGRFQTVLVDQGTLVLQAHPRHLSRCIDCRSCVRVCPTDIDIRNGYQIECINCARCLDACRQVMAPKNQPGIIEYTFGIRDKGIKSLLNLKTGSILLIVLILGTAFIYTAAHRATARLKIGRSQISSLVANDKQITFYQGVIINFKNQKTTLQLMVEDEAGSRMSIKGPSVFTLDNRQKKSINFAVITPPKPDNKPIPLLFLLQDGEGNNLQQIKGFY